MSIAGSFSFHQEPRIVLRHRRPRHTARQRAEKMICRTVAVAFIVLAGCFAAPLLSNHSEEPQVSAQMSADSVESPAETVSGAPVRVIQIYRVEE
jgi:hypothetical protein